MKTMLIQSQKLALLGLACVCAAGLSITAHAQHVPIGTNEISYADFDNGGAIGYGYFYGDPGGLATYAYDNAYLDLGSNGTVVMQYTFDNAALAGMTGYGTGFGNGSLPWVNDPAAFNSTNLADYILSWDARVEGLAPDQTTANCQMEFRLNSGSVLVLQKNFGYNPGSNWVHFRVALDEGGFGGDPLTSAATFINGIATTNENGGITAVYMNQNQHEPYNQFGSDADNAIYLDNIKLEVLQYAGPPPPPPPKVVSGTILDWNLDDKPIWWGSGGWNWSANEFKATGAYSFGTNAAGDTGEINAVGVGGSSGWVLWMTNSDLAMPNTPAWAGIGMNGGGPIDPSLFTSPDLADYKFTFDCRAEGLAESATSAGGMAALVLRAPDDTVQPPDADTGEDTLLRLNFNLPAGTNWQSLTYTLKEGSLDTEGGSSFARFASYYNLISAVMFQCQLNNVTSETTWGYDANNVVVIDNLKLERLSVATPPLIITSSGGNVVLSWAAPPTGTVKLLTGSTVNAITTEVVGATSPYTNAISGASKYFRTQWIAPVP